MADKRRPILYKGELYSKAIDRRQVVIPKEPTVSYEAARNKVLGDLKNVEETIETMPPNMRMPHEAIVSFQVQEEYAAKSYYPSALFYPYTQSSELQEVGTRLKRVEASVPGKVSFEKHFIIRTSQGGLDQLKKRLQKRQDELSQNFQTDIRKISGINIIGADQKINVEDDWSDGRLEVTLHPFHIDRSLTIAHFKNLLQSHGLNPDNLKIKQYTDDGLTFISMTGNRRILPILGEYNPLRSVHPIKFRALVSPHRSTDIPGAPITPVFRSRSGIVVGVIDGGYISGNPALDNYTVAEDSVTGAAEPDFAVHGALVTSTILHGAINNYRNNDTLPEPDISVRNFRILSEDSKDPDLYDVIDEIEKIVPANPDIQTYNISLGPVGQIIDTEVHRFTYALDLLSKKHNVLFNVAVGNSGKLAGYNRIQSPSDMVNGMGIGAYTFTRGGNEKADYSCIGPGREGNKLKPDLVAFGGCDRTPIQILSAVTNTRTFTNGTSFATPLVTRTAGRLIGNSGGIVKVLTAKALLIHDASKNSNQLHSKELGHGFLTEDLDVLMECPSNTYTLIYEGELERGNYRSFTIPWINNLVKGRVNIKYTVAVQTAVDPNSPEDYTTSSVKVMLYPNAYKFNYKSPDKKHNRRIDTQSNPSEAAAMLASGWVKSEIPVSESSDSPFAAEGELRQEMKWDTVDTRSVGKYGQNLNDPSFQVHALGRGHRFSGDKVKFTIVMTIDIPGPDVQLYDKIVAQYNALLPVKLQIDNIVRVSS